LNETKRLTVSAVVSYLFTELMGEVGFGEAVER
jgi:hypothetical protein